jgi:hypothetical protein
VTVHRAERAEPAIATGTLIRIMGVLGLAGDFALLARDLIDLALLTNTGDLEHAGVEKAKGAYGDSVVVDLRKAKEHLLGRAGRLEARMRKMAITMPERELRGRIERLRAETPRAITTRGKRRQVDACASRPSALVVRNDTSGRCTQAAQSASVNASPQR